MRLKEGDIVVTIPAPWNHYHDIDDIGIVEGTISSARRATTGAGHDGVRMYFFNEKNRPAYEIGWMYDVHMRLYCPRSGL